MVAKNTIIRVGKIGIPGTLILASLALVVLAMILPQHATLATVKNWILVAAAIALLYLVVRDLFMSAGRKHPIRLTLTAVLAAVLLFLSLEDLRAVPVQHAWLGGVGVLTAQLLILLAFSGPLLMRAVGLRAVDLPPAGMITSQARV